MTRSRVGRPSMWKHSAGMEGYQDWLWMEVTKELWSLKLWWWVRPCEESGQATRWMAIRTWKAATDSRWGEKQTQTEDLSRWIWEVQEKAPCCRVSEVEKEKLTKSIKWPMAVARKKSSQELGQLSSWPWQRYSCMRMEGRLQGVEDKWSCNEIAMIVFCEVWF